MLSGPAFAQRTDRSFNPQLFHPAPGPDQFVTVEPAAPLAHLQYQVGLYLNYARNQLTIYGVEHGNHVARTNLLANSLGLDLYASLGLFNWFQIGLAIPMTLFQNGESFASPNPAALGGTHIAAGSGYAFNDPRLYLKVKFFGRPTGFQIALSHWLSFPFGDDKDFGGERHFTGFSGEGRLLFGWQESRWRVGAYFGFLWRAQNERFFTTVQSQQLTYGGAIAVDVVARHLTVLAEIYGRHDLCTVERADCQLSDINSSPLEIDAAAKIWLIPGLSLNIGVGNGVIAGIGSPQPRVYLGVVWSPSNADRDKDGVLDALDRCPDAPEDRDGFQDRDGCPDLDNDGDGLDDAADKCPNLAEDFDTFQDEDGCPDADNDGDGIDDLHDACPFQAEDGKPPSPKDGCPATKSDADGDGVSDAADKCPHDPEDKDLFEDEDGCPEEGALKARLERGQILLLEKVLFDRAAVLPASFNVLDHVATLLRAHPELKVRVEGYTDAGGKLDDNVALSQARADAVMKYLLGRGIEAARLVAAGYGPANPVADNRTSQGRQANQRIELHIVEVSRPQPIEEQ